MAHRLKMMTMPGKEAYEPNTTQLCEICRYLAILKLFADIEQTLQPAVYMISIFYLTDISADVMMYAKFVIFNFKNFLPFCLITDAVLCWRGLPVKRLDPEIHKTVHEFFSC